MSARLHATTMGRPAIERVRHQLANVQGRERLSRCRGERNRPAKSPHQEDRMFLLLAGHGPSQSRSRKLRFRHGLRGPSKEDPTSVLMHAIESFIRFATF